LEALAGLGADATIRLEGSDDELEEAFADQARDGGFDVVLDYLWGRPTEALVAALTGHDVTAESRRTRLIHSARWRDRSSDSRPLPCGVRAWR
jgi:hypothetical protein